MSSSSAPLTETTTPHPPSEVGRQAPQPERLQARGPEWLEGLELEASTTLWSFDAPQLRTSSDDWSLAEASPKYRVQSTLLYRGDLRLFTSLLDLSAAYESRAGVSFLGARGSLLDLATSIPQALTGLESLSFHYQRVRFEEGEVTLNDERYGALERQRFAMKLDDYELRWAQLLDPTLMLTFKGAWRSRAMPRHIYLEERVNEGEGDAYSVYYAISDQLLWVPTQVIDLGLSALMRLSAALTIEIGAGLGGGDYQLLTPLEGELLDGGELLSLSTSWGVSYDLPLTPWLDLRCSYHGQLLFLEPYELPRGIKKDIQSEGLDDDPFTLAFGGRDLLQRFWLSLIIHLE